MKEFSAAATIHADPGAVWQLLTDASSWVSWDPTVERFEGTIAPGEKVTIYSKLSPGRGFPVTVSHFAPTEKMVWRSGMPLGLFSGERTFTLRKAGRGQTHYRVHEVFRGILLPLIGRTLPDMTKAFQQHASGLKQRAEQ